MIDHHEMAIKSPQAEGLVDRRNHILGSIAVKITRSHVLNRRRTLIRQLGHPRDLPKMVIAVDFLSGHTNQIFKSVAIQVAHREIVNNRLGQTQRKMLFSQNR